MPGCHLHVSPELTLSTTVSGDRAIWSLLLPNQSELIGREFFTQAAVLDPAANALGVSLSNSLQDRIGSR